MIFLICTFFTPTGFSQQQPETGTNDKSVAEKTQEINRLQKTREQLESINNSIEDRQEQSEALKKKLQTSKDEAEQKDLQQQIAEIEKAIQDSQDSFKSIASGGIDLGAISELPLKKFDWRSDLSEILKPIFEGLKGITEKPRTVEKLRNAIEFHKNQLQTIESALMQIQLLKSESLEKEVSLRLNEIEATWLQREVDVKRELSVTEHQLQNISEQQKSFWISIQDGFSSFFKGRGLTLILAIIAATTIWFILKGLLKVIWGRKNVDEARIQGPYSRLLVYGYRALSIFLTLTTLLLVLYFSGDWLLLGLSLLLLVGLVIGFKNHFFKFLSETKLILNLGPVREGERVIYSGIPWRVSSLNFYSLLVNPCLQGGILRLPLSEVATLISRPYQKEEIWFPSDVGDFVLLSNGTFGEVIQQTPEIVRLKTFGAARTFSVSEYLDLSPRNLSQDSYGFQIVFGIDYQHQAVCLDQVVPVFKEAVTKAISQSDAGKHLEDVIVDFREAGASSLDYLVYVVMNGRAASSYWSLQRIVQQACVKACNHHNWIIPFNQLTIHQGEGFNKLL